jgi:cyanophycinase
MAKKEANGCPVPAGILMMIGGKENKGQEDDKKGKKENFSRLEVLKHFAELIEKDDPRVEIVTTAGSDPDETYKEYKDVFAELGMKNTGHIHHNLRKELLDDPMVERASAADAIFFTGGDQLVLTAVYGGTPFLIKLKERYISDRLVIAGTSAGAMALSTPMIYAGNEEVQQLGGEIKVTTGLEFFKDMCIDTHFVDRGRFVRMAQVIATNPTCIGVGIEEDTAVVVRNGRDIRVEGTGTIILIDGSEIADTNIKDFNNQKPVSIKDLRVHILAKGDEHTIPLMNPPHY